jgi:hypothetical protein
MKTIRDLINNVLKKHKIPVWRLANHPGVSCNPTTVTRYLNGELNITSEHLESLMRVVGIRPEVIDAPDKALFLPVNGET